MLMSDSPLSPFTKDDSVVTLDLAGGKLCLRVPAGGGLCLRVPAGDTLCLRAPGRAPAESQAVILGSPLNFEA